MNRNFRNGHPESKSTNQHGNKHLNFLKKGSKPHIFDFKGSPAVIFVLQKNTGFLYSIHTQGILLKWATWAFSVSGRGFQLV